MLAERRAAAEFIRIKICGVTREDDLSAVSSSGAAYIGLNFFKKSPRYVGLGQARSLAVSTPPGLVKVGLVVDADNAFLDRLCQDVPLDMLQLHGDETPNRVAEVKARYGLPVMKAIGIAEAEDIAQISAFASVADQLLIDAKPPKNAVLPGGNGVRFDWRLLQGRRWPVPWMLAGGLRPENVAEAISLTGARQVDVSSGVEQAPGDKCAALISAFSAATRAQKFADNA